MNKSMKQDRNLLFVALKIEMNEIPTTKSDAVHCISFQDTTTLPHTNELSLVSMFVFLYYV